MKTKSARLITTFLLVLNGTFASGQSGPTLNIAVQSPNSVQLNWNSQSGTQYQLLGTPEIDVFSLWTPVGGPITATGPNTSVTQGATSDHSFFKVHVLGQPASGLPTAKILSPAPGETLSGLVKVIVSAQDDSRLSSVALLVDGVEYETPITEGDLFWYVNTGHYQNGAHTLQVRALDNVGSAAFGGNPNSDLAANETLSSPITVNFANLTHWIEPVSGFETFVPISIRSDVFPSAWTVYVENEAGTIIRTFGGTTTDGVIETEWDGNDNNGVPAPSHAAYRVIFTLGENQAASGSSAMSESVGEAAPAPAFAGYNQYGIPEYEVTTPLVKLPDIFFDSVVQEKISKGQLPPLPPVTAKQIESTIKPGSVTKRRVSLLEAAGTKSLTAKSAVGNTENSQAVMAFNPPAANDVIVWREGSWSSGQIIIARQRYRGLLTAQTLNAALAANMATLNTDITAASLADDRLGNRTVYGSSVFVADVPGDFDTLLNDLKQPTVTDFYYHGHSNGEAIGYSEGSPNNGITSDRLSLALVNLRVRNSPRWNGRWLLIFNSPFRFVFLDGCLSSKGTLKHAFGIIPDNDHTRLGKKRRAYLGWGTTTQNSIANNNQVQWSGKFWKEWVNTDIDDYDVWLQNAIANATAAKPIPFNPIITGYRRLSWAE